MTVDRQAHASYAFGMSSRTGRCYVILEVTREQHRELKRRAKKSKTTISNMIRKAMGLKVPAFNQRRAA